MTFQDNHRYPHAAIVSENGDGAFVISHAAKHLYADDDQLRCVDLINNAHLESLDLSGCASPVHLSVRGCPNLTTVILPNTSSGAVLHWEFSSKNNIVEICGSLASFDSCQPDGHTCQIKSSLDNYEHVIVVPPGSSQTPQGNEVDLFIHLAAESWKFPGAVECAQSLRAAYLRSSISPEELDLNWERLSELHFVKMSGLKTIKAGPSMSRLSITQCPNIQNVTASGEYLRICKTGGEKIVLTGVWNIGYFESLKARLEGGLVGSTRSQNCYHILSDITDLSNATAPLSALPSPDAIHDPYWRTTLHKWVATTTSSAALLPALKILHALLETGDNPELIWRARCDLHGRHAKLPKKISGITPLWRAPRDLAFETQQADFQLWQACNAQGVEDPLYTKDLRTLPWVLPMAILARAARIALQDQQNQYLSDLKSSVEKFIQRDSNYSGQPEPTENTLIGFARLIEGLLPLRNHPAAMAIFSDLPNLLQKTLPAPSRLSPLTALNQMGLAGAGASLLTQAKVLLADDAEMAAKFHAAALQPPRSDLLSGITKGNYANAD